MGQRKLYAIIAGAIGAHTTCQARGHMAMWAGEHKARAEHAVAEHMPSGSGLDAGVKLDWLESTAEKLVFTTSFHHMDDQGSYAGWSDHTITVRASLVLEIEIKVGGRDRNQIKDYLAELFSAALLAEIDDEALAKAAQGSGHGGAGGGGVGHP